MAQKYMAPGPHVLLVEDNPAYVLLVREAFEDSKAHCTLSVARDGREALDFVHRCGNFRDAKRPDLILLDLNLPRIDGYEVLSRLKADEAFREIPVVILTTSQSLEDVHKAYSLAANCYVCKPLALDEFFKLMKALQEFWLERVRFPGARG